MLNNIPEITFPKRKLTTLDANIAVENEPTEKLSCKSQNKVTEKTTDSKPPKFNMQSSCKRSKKDNKLNSKNSEKNISELNHDNRASNIAKSNGSVDSHTSNDIGEWSELVKEDPIPEKSLIIEINKDESTTSPINRLPLTESRNCTISEEIKCTDNHQNSKYNKQIPMESDQVVSNHSICINGNSLESSSLSYCRETISTTIDMFDHDIDTELSALVKPREGTIAHRIPHKNLRVITQGLTIADAPITYRNSRETSPSEQSADILEETPIPRRKVSDHMQEESMLANTPSEVAAEILYRRISDHARFSPVEGCECGNNCRLATSNGYSTNGELETSGCASASNGSEEYPLGGNSNCRCACECEHNCTGHDDECKSSEYHNDGEDDGGFRFIGDDTSLACELAREMQSNPPNSQNCSISEVESNKLSEHDNTNCESSVHDDVRDGYINKIARSHIGSTLTIPGYNWSPPERLDSVLNTSDKRGLEEFVMINMRTQSQSELVRLSRMEQRLEAESARHNRCLQRSARRTNRSDHTTEQNRQREVRRKRNREISISESIYSDLVCELFFNSHILFYIIIRII